MKHLTTCLVSFLSNNVQTFIACLISFVLFTSCSSQDKFRSPEVYRSVIISTPFFEPYSYHSNSESNMVNVIPNSLYRSRNYSELTNEELKAWGERTYVYELEKKIDYWPPYLNFSSKNEIDKYRIIHISWL